MHLYWIILYYLHLIRLSRSFWEVKWTGRTALSSIINWFKLFQPFPTVLQFLINFLKTKIFLFEKDMLHFFTLSDISYFLFARAFSPFWSTASCLYSSHNLVFSDNSLVSCSTSSVYFAFSSDNLADNIVTFVSCSLICRLSNVCSQVSCCTWGKYNLNEVYAKLDFSHIFYFFVKYFNNHTFTS